MLKYGLARSNSVATLMVACLLAAPALAGEEPPPARGDATVPPTEPATAPPTAPVLEATREAVRSGATWLARSVDSWFGDLRFEDGGSVTQGRLALSLLRREGESLDHRVRFDASLRLPNVERNAYLFLGRDNERETVTDLPDALSQRQRLIAETPQQQSFFGGLGVTLLDLFDLRLGLRGGLKLYAQARYRTTFALGQGNIAGFSHSFFWTVQDQLGATTALSLERELAPTLTVRWLNSTTITRRREEFEWFSLLGAYHAFEGGRLLSLEGLASGVHGAPVDVADAGVRVRWAQRVWREWLVGELLVGHFWPRADASLPRDRRWGYGVGLTMKL
ncbi:MAG: hypothetical protein JNJ89_10830 [Rubrivivax sp.]|nr:hypothetical protein [Rubrivivax sp.]